MFRIASKAVGQGQIPFIIAEMSGNHNGSLQRALALVDAAADAGAQALKIQTYTADTMTIDLAEREFVIKDEKSLWNGSTLYKLYQQASTPWDWHKPIFDRCRARGMVGFSTPFDPTAVNFLESLDVPCYKVASFENVDHDLIRAVARTGKPVIISTGLAQVAEIAEAVAVGREAGCKDLALLKCTSAYPANPASSNLATIPHMRELFGCEIGLSDHTMGIGVSVAAGAGTSVCYYSAPNLNHSSIRVDIASNRAPSPIDAGACADACSLRRYTLGACPARTFVGPLPRAALHSPLALRCAYTRMPSVDSEAGIRLSRRSPSLFFSKQILLVAL